MHEARYLLVTNGNVTASLVGDMHVVPLLHQATDGTSHGDDIIIRMWREHHDTFRVGQCALWTIGIVSIGFAARPPGNRMLQFIEHLDVHQSCRAEFLHPMAHIVLQIVFGRQFQNGFACGTA